LTTADTIVYVLWPVESGDHAPACSLWYEIKTLYPYLDYFVRILKMASYACWPWEKTSLRFFF